MRGGARADGIAQEGPRRVPGEVDGAGRHMERVGVVFAEEPPLGREQPGASVADVVERRLVGHEDIGIRPEELDALGFQTFATEGGKVHQQEACTDITLRGDGKAALAEPVVFHAAGGALRWVVLALDEARAVGQGQEPRGIVGEEHVAVGVDAPIGLDERGQTQACPGRQGAIPCRESREVGLAQTVAAEVEVGP